MKPCPAFRVCLIASLDSAPCEQDFPATYDVRLALTSWAKAHFEVLHTGYGVDPGEEAIGRAIIPIAAATICRVSP
jgi:hypothetical protein